MTILTTGIPAANPGLRQDIRTLLRDTDLTNLYLLGLQSFQAKDQQDPLSWFQIAGIHGRPYIPYDGSGKRGAFGGYCTHSSILFPTWHRPYLALYEQALTAIINQIANSYPNPADKTKYTAAALRFRIPYWDWASDSVLPDIIAKLSTVSVYTPTGQKTIPNPLYAYKFHPIYSDFGDGLPDERTWEGWQSTLRYPSSTAANGVSQPNVMEQSLANNRLTLRDRTYNLLTQAVTYEAFSNDGFPGTRANPIFFDSLESIHGQIHGLTGRNGHMGVIDYAAFDPVFWLHHTNVDRIFTIWQAINPTKFVVRRQNTAGTFTTTPGTFEDNNSPLTPFWKAPGQYWTSDGVRDTRTFGYTYPELAKWSTLSAAEKSVRIRTDVNTLYGKTSPAAVANPSVFQGSKSTSAGAASAGAKVATGSVAAATPAAKIASVSVPAVAATPAAAKVASVPVAAASPPAVKLASVHVASATPAATPSGSAAKVSAAAPKPSGQVSAAAAKVASAAPVAAPAAQVVLAPAPPVASSSVAPDAVEVTGVKKDDGHWHDNDDKSDDKKHYHEWFANIVVEKYAVKSSFFVYIFLGDFTPDSDKWDEDLNLVGTHVVFANNLSFTGCERCHAAHEQHKLVTGTIPLTGALGDKLPSQAAARELEPDLVIPYLQRNLHWRIKTHDGTPVEREDIPSLKISVAHAIVELPTSIAEFPTWGEATNAPAVTTGRPGGASEND